MFIATIPATTGDKSYTIRKVGDQFICSCHDHIYQSNGQPYVCKHLAAFARELVSFATEAKKSKSAEKILTQAG